jgi:hypothetical protein
MVVSCGKLSKFLDWKHSVDVFYTKSELLADERQIEMSLIIGRHVVYIVYFPGSEVFREKPGWWCSPAATAAAPHIASHGAPSIWPGLPLLLRGVGPGAVRASDTRLHGAAGGQPAKYFPCFAPYMEEHGINMCLHAFTKAGTATLVLDTPPSY